ncbi:MAG TPA: lysylphosphatidylglycerol synthase domain-containing protein [Sphingomonas sp.]|nr:lysylphosphatidylglycerol synthase domain-containing protein [Sphingomonas sp.]
MTGEGDNARRAEDARGAEDRGRSGLAALRRMLGRQPLWSRLLGIVAMFGAAAIAIVLLRRLLAHVRPAEVAAVFATLDPQAVLLSLAGAAGSYLALTLYDYLALDVTGHPLPWRRAALTSFCAYSLSHNLGLGVLTGGSARYRLYSRAGLSPADVARVVALTGFTFALGVLAVIGIALLRDPKALGAGGIALPWWIEDSAGGVILALLAAAVLLPRGRGRRLRWRRWSMPLPDRRHLALQILVSTIDLSCASLSLFALLPHMGAALYPSFVLSYAVALVAGLASYVPGGLGVFEAVMLAALPEIAPAELLAALIAFRVIYYWIPLLLGGGLFATLEARAARRRRAAG